MEKLFLNLKNKFQKNKVIIKNFLNIILLIISFGVLIYFCIENGNWYRMIKIAPKLNLKWIVLAILSIMLSWYFESLSIFEIIRFVENAYIKKSKIYQITIVGQYFTSITPMGVGSPPYQTSELVKINLQKNSATTIIGTKFIIYQISLAVYSLICAILYCTFYRLNSYLMLIYLIVGLGFQMFTVMLVLIFLINKNLFVKIENISKCIPLVLKYKKYFAKIKYSINFFANSFKNILKNKLLIIKLFFYSFIQISIAFSIPFFVFKSFQHSSSPVLEIIQTQCIANTICSFTPLPGNAGTSEKIFLDLFGNFFFENEIVTAMVIHRILTLYFSIIIGAVVYFLSKIHSKSNQQNQ